MCGILRGIGLFAVGRILVLLEFGVQVAGQPRKCYFAGHLSPVTLVSAEPGMVVL